MTSGHVDAVAQLRAELDAARATLLAALEGLTDRDFAAELADGETITSALASLAPTERQAVRVARVAVGLPTPALAEGGAPRTRAIPPQVMHDLAGARYGTLHFLEGIEAAALNASTPEGTVGAVLARVVEREHAVAERIAARPMTTTSTSASPSTQRGASDPAWRLEPPAAGRVSE